MLPIFEDEAAQPLPTLVSLDSGEPTPQEKRPFPPVREWLGQLLLVLLFSVSAHASKNALAPAQPALESIGLSPLLYSVIAAVPMVGSIALPTAWGVAYADFERQVLIAVPLGEFVGQLLIAAGLWLLDAPSVPLAWAGGLLSIGLLIFSAFHGGAHVVQCAVLSRVMPSYEATGFVATIGFTHFIVALCNFAVPLIMERYGILGVQLALLIPGLISIAAGCWLATLASGFTVPHSRTDPRVNKLLSTQFSKALSSALLEDVRVVRVHAAPKLGCLDGLGVLGLLGLWKALVMGALLSFRTIKNGLVVSFGVSKVEAGSVIGTNQMISLLLLPIIAVLSDVFGRRFLIVFMSWAAAAAAVVLSMGSLLPQDAWVGALFIFSSTGLVVPVVALSLVRDNSKRSLGRAFGLLETLFSLAQAIFTVALGALREDGGFSYAMDFVCGTLTLGAVTSLFLAYAVKDGADRA